LELYSGPGISEAHNYATSLKRNSVCMVEVHVWSEFRQTIVDEAIDEWRK